MASDTLSRISGIQDSRGWSPSKVGKFSGFALEVQDATFGFAHDVLLYLRRHAWLPSLFALRRVKHFGAFKLSIVWVACQIVPSHRISVAKTHVSPQHPAVCR